MSHCLKCGKCCWNFKDGDPHDRCDHLADDLVTCLIYDGDRMACGGLADDWPQPRHAVDLPEDCGFVIYWKAQGLI